MSDEITKADLDDLRTTVIIVGAVVASLAAITIILGIVIIVCVSRILKKVNDLSLTVKTTRSDVRKTLETVESSIVKNLLTTFDDNLDQGTEPASPIFTTRMYQPSPTIPFNVNPISANRVSEGFDRNRKDRRPGPPVPPKRAHSFYDNNGPYY